MDQHNTLALHRCLREIERRLGWGPAGEWSGADFAELSERLLDATGVRLSPTTLKRVWGRISYAGSPSPTTLDTLASFAGEDNWQHWKTTIQATTTRARQKPAAAAARSLRNRVWLPVAAGLALLLVLALLAARNSAPPPLDQEDFAFTARPVAQGIPNSVVFDYRAEAAPSDSVFIQQSWDTRRRTRVARTGSSHTAIYYEPGFFRAKLVVGNQIVREQELFVPSAGWVVAAYPPGGRVPVYFPPDSLRTADRALALAPARIHQAGLSLQPYAPLVRYSYVDTFARGTSHELSFSAEFLNSHYGGAAVCQRTRVIVLLKNDAIIIPLSQPGCVAALSLYAPGTERTGATDDLSAFGTDLRAWTRLRLSSTAGLLSIYLNDTLASRLKLTGPPKPVVGVRIEMSGTGAIRELRIGARDLLWD